MTKQSEALEIADELDALEDMCGSPILEMRAANELRRLHEVNVELLAALKNLIVKYQGKKQGVWGELTPEMLSARAAITKVEKS